MSSSSCRTTDKTLPGRAQHLYPKEVWYGLTIFLLIVGCIQWGSFMHSKFAARRRRIERPDMESTSPSTTSRRKYSIRRLPLAAVNAYRVVAFRWTVQIGKSYTFNTAEVLVAVSYVALLFASTFINTSAGGKKFNVSYWSGRAGLMAASQVPFVTALGTKHNPVSLITGISHDKLNYAHRITARTCFTLLLVHVVGEIYKFTHFRAALHDVWLRAGITAVVVLGILCTVSVRPLRAANYEFFFYTHFVAVLIFLLGGYYHTKAVHASTWIWPSFVIWGFDRCLRVIRVVAFNCPYFCFAPGSRALDASTEVLPDDFVRVRLRRPPHFCWKPGQAVYIIMPSVSRLPFEAHPFSIASIDSALFSADEKDGSNTPPRGTADWKELVLLISVRGGFTRRLRDAAARNKTVKVLIDGPYGPSPELRCYDTSILIAGGSGVTYTLPVFLNIVECARNGVSNCSRVVFIWAIRDTDSLRWVDSMLHKANELVPPGLEISIRIFVTGGPRITIEGDSLDGKGSIMSTRWLTTETGRPDFGAILKEEMDRTCGRISVNVCGSQNMAESVRRALRFSGAGPLNVLRGGPSVTLCIESFGYA